MDWTALFEMLKGVFANDPTMILLLTIGFFFLKTIWPTPEPASTQILRGYADRIRQALASGNVPGAKLLADAAVEKAETAMRAEVEPKVGGILDVIKGLFGNQTLMPLLLIGGVVMLLMLSGSGGCGGCAAVKAEPPAAIETTSQWRVTGEPERFVWLGGDGRSTDAPRTPLVFCAGEPWAWADNGTAVEPGSTDRRGLEPTNSGPGSAVDLAGIPPLGDGVVCPAAGCGRGCSASGRPAVRTAPAVSRLALRRGQPVRNVARLFARPFRWLRLPGRPFARLFGRR